MRYIKFAMTWFLCGVASAASAAAPDDVRLASPPVAMPDAAEQPDSVATVAGVDNLNRYAVGRLVQTTWAAQAAVPPNWTGNVAGCVPGTTSQAYRQATIDRVNLYRVVAGLPGTVQLIGGAAATQTQAAALLFAANQNIRHDPPTTWMCWTQDAYNGAKNSNIGIAWNSNDAAGPGAVTLYMDDDNVTSVGHRRWMLYPPQVAMDSGSVPLGAASGGVSTNALYVFATEGARPTTPDGIAWPARGYMPALLLPRDSHYWSLSLQNADFSAATVAMTKDGVAMAPPAIQPLQSNGQPYAPHMGDNTLVWQVSGVDDNPSPVRDVTYHVVVSDIAGPGVPTSVAWDVIVFDADDPIFAAGFE